MDPKSCRTSPNSHPGSPRCLVTCYELLQIFTEMNDYIVSTWVKDEPRFQLKYHSTVNTLDNLNKSIQHRQLNIFRFIWEGKSDANHIWSCSTTKKGVLCFLVVLGGYLLTQKGYFIAGITSCRRLRSLCELPRILNKISLPWIDLVQRWSIFVMPASQKSSSWAQRRELSLLVKTLPYSI